MVAISSSASAVRYSAQQAAVPQVRRAAEQAQQAANALQAQARDAWQKVDSAEANARAVDTRANQANSTAAEARQNLVSFGAGVLSAGSATKADKPDTKATPVAVSTPSTAAVSVSVSRSAPILMPAVINTQGQRIGTLINVTA